MAASWKYGEQDDYRIPSDCLILLRLLPTSLRLRERLYRRDGRLYIGSSSRCSTTNGAHKPTYMWGQRWSGLKQAPVALRWVPNFFVKASWPICCVADLTVHTVAEFLVHRGLIQNGRYWLCNTSLEWYVAQTARRWSSYVVESTGRGTIFRFFLPGCNFCFLWGAHLSPREG